MKHIIGENEQQKRHY